MIALAVLVIGVLLAVGALMCVPQEREESDDQ